MAHSKLSDQALTTTLKGREFVAELLEGYHFNEKAPNLLIVDEERLKPKSLAKRRVSFQLASPNFTTGRASLYVCDDAETFCEPRLVELKGGGAESASVAAPVAKKKKAPKLNSHGFIIDDLDAAIDRAEKESKLVLADFSARWCPGCVRLESEILDTKAFRTKSKKFVKVRLDFDRFETLELKKAFDVRAIPTLIALTPQREEISRIVDFQAMPVLSEFLKDAESNPLPFSQLKAKADAGDKPAGLVLGRRLYNAERFEEALPYLEGASPAPVELFDTRVKTAKERMAKDAAKKPEFQKTVREAIRAEPKSMRSIVWRRLLIESIDAKEADERKKIAIEGMNIADELLADPARMTQAARGHAIGEFTGYERLLLAADRAELAEAAPLADDAIEAARKKVAAVGKELKIPVAKTGPALRMLIFLVYAKEFADAEKLGREMLKRDPENPELQRRLIRVLNEQEKYEEAIAFGRKALPNSFGKNEVWVAQQLAKAYAGHDQKKEAKALAESYLKRPDIDWSAMKSEHKDLSDLVQSIQ